MFRQPFYSEVESLLYVLSAGRLALYLLWKEDGDERDTVLPSGTHNVAGQSDTSYKIEFSQYMDEDISKVHKVHRRRSLSACVTCEPTWKCFKSRDYDPCFFGSSLMSMIIE